MPQHKDKLSKDECINYSVINLLSVPGKVYGRVLMEKLMKVNGGKVSEEQGEFRKEKSCVDQIFEIKIMMEEYLGKDEKLFASFMDIDNIYES